MTSLFQLTDGEMTELKGRFSRAGLTAELARQINHDSGNALAKTGIYAMLAAVNADGTITVPDLSAMDMLAVAKEKAVLTYLDFDYQKYAFIKDEKGKKFEVATWAPGRGVSSDAVREYFRALGFEGNPAAFVAWITKVDRDGWYVSIPEDARCFAIGDALFAPYFGRDGSRRGLRLLRLANGWYSDRVFVAFREIPHK